MNKRIIFEQADDLVSQVDVLVETYIAANQDHPDRVSSVNEMRDNWLKVIRECESYNLLHCRENEEGKAPLQKSDLFKQFCLLFETNTNVISSGRFTWHLLVIPNIYLSPGQIVCFQELMRIIEATENRSLAYEKVPLWQNSIDKIFNMRASFENVRKHLKFLICFSVKYFNSSFFLNIES
jgi:hypothetical protein